MLLQSSCFDFQECSGFPWWVGSRLVVWILKKSPCKRDCYLGLALGSQTTGPQTPKPKPFVDLLLVLRLFQWEIHGSLWFQQAKCCQDSPSIQCQIDRCIYIYISLRIQSASQMMIGVYNHLLSKVFRFHYHSQKVIGSLGYRYTGLLREQLYTCFGRLKLPQQQRFLLEGVHFGVYPIIKISNEFPQNQAGRILG